MQIWRNLVAVWYLGCHGYNLCEFKSHDLHLGIKLNQLKNLKKKNSYPK